MPNATVRADARTMPETHDLWRFCIPNRRGLLLLADVGEGVR
jgi:hypothetical protein